MKFLFKQKTVSLRHVEKILLNCHPQAFNRLFTTSLVTSKSFFVSTPIYYVNSSPHIGHMYTTFIADATQRFQKLQGASPIIFSTGTDEHGLKVQQAASSAGVDTQVFCDQFSEKFEELFKNASIPYTHFIRTSAETHKAAVQHFLGVLNDKGYIYQDAYEGWYSINDECFVPSNQLKQVVLPSGDKQVINEESDHPCQWHKETNYIFKLSVLKDKLLYWVNEPKRIVPSRFQDELKVWIGDELNDLSISRPKSRVSWGIPFPMNTDHTLYVWVDALINYLTVSGYPKLTHWPPDLQVIGKDILRFHGIYWPALLIAAELEPPRQLLVHSHWTVAGDKISKSKGNSVCPLQLQKRLTSDGFRFYMLRTGTPPSDSNWDETMAVRSINSELVNNLANLVSRCTALSLNPNQVFPSLAYDFSTSKYKDLISTVQMLPDKVHAHYSDYNFYKGIDVVMSMLNLANSFIQDEKPWELKHCSNREKLDSIIHISLSCSYVAAIALQPIIPDMSSKLLDMLNIPCSERSWKFIQKYPSKCVDSHKLNERLALMPRIK